MGIALFKVEMQHFLFLPQKHGEVSKLLYNKGKTILVEIFPLHGKQKENKYMNKTHIFIFKFSSSNLVYIIITG